MMPPDLANPSKRAKAMSHQIAAVKGTNCLVAFDEALAAVLYYTTNLVTYPEEEKFRCIKMDSVHFEERILSVGGSLKMLQCLGFEVNDRELVFDNSRTDLAVLRAIRETILREYQLVQGVLKNLPRRTNDSHPFKSVAGCGCYSTIGRRPTMEDEHLAIDAFLGVPSQGFFAVYDGHGGRETVNYVVKALHLNLEHSMKGCPTTPIASHFKNAYLTTDAQVRRRNIITSGTTAVTCLVRTTKSGARQLCTANVGDSRAVLARAGDAVRLSIDHKPDSKDEKKRIEDSGGCVSAGRIEGLAVSRALGDHMLKGKDFVVANPYCVDTELGDQDKFLILACDGIWDVMTDQQAVDFVGKELSRDRGERDTDAAQRNVVLRRISEKLVREALRKNSSDNVTAMIVRF